MRHFDRREIRVIQPAGDIPSNFCKFRASLPVNTTVSDLCATRGAVPKVTRKGSEREMCIQWHVLCRCFALCKRAEDHVRQSNAEAAALHRWCVSLATTSPKSDGCDPALLL